MTAERFRASAERVGRMRDLLNDAVLAQAIVCLKDERPDPALPIGADAIASVRVQAKLEQHEAAVNLLLSLAEPLPVNEPEPEPTYGVDLAQFKPA